MPGNQRSPRVPPSLGSARPDDSGPSVPSPASDSADPKLRRWDAVSQAALATRILGMPVNVAASLAVLIAAPWLLRFAFHDRSLVELAVLAIAGTVATAAVAAIVWAVALPARDRRAVEAFAWCGERGRTRFLALSDGRYSLTPRGIERYVLTTPERPDDRWIRAEYHAMKGHLDEARALLERIEPTTAQGAVELAGDRDWVDWIGGGPGDLDAIRSALDQVPADGSDDRFGAEMSLAMAEVRHRLSDGVADPIGPLLAVRDRLGTRADGILFLTARRGLRSYLTAAGLMVLLSIGVDRLLG